MCQLNRMLYRQKDTITKSISDYQCLISQEEQLDDFCKGEFNLIPLDWKKSHKSKKVYIRIAFLKSYNLVMQ